MTNQDSNTDMDANEGASALPWYKDGLRFKCTECGKCCTGAPGFVWVTEEEIEDMAEALKMPTQTFMIKYVRRRDNRYALNEIKVKDDEYACVFLKDKKCTLYHNRPKQCRTFPWWQHNLNSPRSWQLAAGECEGINEQAPLLPYSQIIQIVNSNESQK